MMRGFSLRKINGLTVCVSEGVYEPSDDSFLLIDYMLSNPDELRGKTVVDVGSGTGILSLFALSQGARHILAIDINPAALRATKCTLEANGYESFDVIGCDTLACLRGVDFADVVLFNPPYLPVDLSDEECQDPLSLAWCGGASGTEVALRAINVISRVGPPGTFLIVLSSLGDYEKVIDRLRELGYKIKIVSSKRFFFEEIMLIRGERDGQGDTS